MTKLVNYFRVKHSFIISPQNGISSVTEENDGSSICKEKLFMFMLLLLSHSSHVRLRVTPQMAAHQAPPSLGFSKQEHWSGWPFPSPMHESEKWKKSLSHVRLLATPLTAAHQAPLSMGFSRQEYWSGVPVPSPLHVYLCTQREMSQSLGFQRVSFRESSFYNYLMKL